MKIFDNNTLYGSKYNELETYIKNLGSCAIGFSGGVDSTFLIAVAQIALQEKAIAYTIVSPHMAKWETQESIELAKGINITHHLIHLPIIDKITNNPVNRCYFCKTDIYSYIKKEANNNEIIHILDGSNADDVSDVRPGMKALKEHGIKSPLLELGFTKEIIRYFSKEMGLPTWDKPSNACLPSRLPYNTVMDEAILNKIEQAELFMKKQGFKTVRVRILNDIAKIEVAKDKISDLVLPENRLAIRNYFSEIGYEKVQFDIDGYITGKMNKAGSMVEVL